MSILLQGAKFKKRLMPLLFPMMLAGCTNFFGSSFTNVLKNDANASSDFYMNKIEQTQEIEDKQTYTLLAARVMVTENKVPQAEALLAELKDLTPEQQLDKSIVEAHISAIKNKNSLAAEQLKVIDLTKLSASQKSRYYEVAARIAENKREIIEAVKARIQKDYNLTDVQRKQENIDRTWALLRSANKGTINNTSAEGNVALAGWLALAKAYNDNMSQPAQLNKALEDWKASYPNHSAAYMLPTELRSVSNFQQTQLNKVTLLLPLSGDASLIGSTVKAGFDDSRGADTSMQVETIDTIATPIQDALSQAKQGGSSAIVGPLLKPNVDAVINNASAVQGMDVLALNSTHNSRAINQMCYYGLSPEDEAESAADKMWNDNIREPLVLVPQSDLGQRTASAFNVRWQQLAATDANIVFFRSTDDVSVALQSGAAQAAKAVYVVATDSELVDIKSTIDNANKGLQIYASSRSNTSNSTPEYRLQMNGVKFSDIPFFKESDSSQYQKILQATNGDYSLMRLYAMGADAWLLINKFNELRQVPGYSVSGLTGTLSAGPNCNIERSMTWYQYQDGNVIPLN
ncbi:penicillin-binding protein activator [Bisgaard Taxon 10/6]|uniref:Penicillin-binding protein activator LpoA n=1 Tax=Exercitatus varius TaxID=67857 RepID=A0AAW6QAW7_9PAST|nr:penicillin-binding protein activator [Exercitatus varius]MDG2915003.1 penicillin-binding protein activator [Exercitatus varius]MDG2916703.1 penicillin-binding protein activator [Exercitatus varius]MDG2950448.1 penicillin-binding protein activator [Exercitatus varius]MDG2951309.1 penicillin-binding protein activator [Exercitatus varius]